MTVTDRQARDLAERINRGIEFVRTNPLSGWQLGIGPLDAVILTTDHRFFAWLAAAPWASDAVFALANRALEACQRPEFEAFRAFRPEMVEDGWAVEMAVSPRMPEVVL